MKSYKHGSFYESKLTRSPMHSTGVGLLSTSDEVSYSVGNLGLGANRVGGWDVNAVEDRVNDATRRDFAGFRLGDPAARGPYKKGEESQVSGGPHVGSSTIIYTAPPGGWDDDATPLRCAHGGYVDAVSSGKQKVEKDIRTVGGKFSGGYEVGNKLVSKQVSRRKKGEEEKDSLDEYVEVRAQDGSLVLPLPSGSTSGTHQPDPPPWTKGGALPPRLQGDHEFRAFAGTCHVANPDIKAVQSSMSVFHQVYDPVPLIRFRVNGSALTGHERKRLDRIIATPGTFGKTLETEIRDVSVQSFPGRVLELTKEMADSVKRKEEGNRPASPKKKKPVVKRRT